MESRLDEELAVLDVDVVGGCCGLLEFAVAFRCVSMAGASDGEMDEPETTHFYLVRPDAWV